MRERDFVPVCYGKYNESLKDHPGLPVWSKSCGECEFLDDCKSMTEVVKNPNILYENYIPAPKREGLPYDIVIEDEDGE